MKELIGKVVHALYVNEDESILAFDTAEGIVAYKTYADCCSETWFADITGVFSLLGGTVLEVEEQDMEGYNVEDGRTRQDYDEAYGVKIKTDKGYVDIVYRNSSNGYYGGECVLMTSPLDLSTLKAITDDWQA